MNLASMAAGAALLAAALLATACTSVVGVTDIPSKTCDGTSATDACSFCLVAACCEPLETCVGDATCSALLSCADACQPGDSACVGGCSSQYGSAAAAMYGAWVDCSLSSCTSTCSSQ